MSGTGWYGVPVPYADRDEWLELRRTGLGASEVAAIVGVSPYDSPYSVWARKVGEIPERSPDEAMMWGTLLEAAIRKRVEWITGLHAIAIGAMVRHPSEPWAFATLDGALIESEPSADELLTPMVDREALRDVVAVLEIKNSVHFRRFPELPDEIQIQVQWQMLCTGLGAAIVAVLHGGRRLERYDVEADERLQSVLLGAAREFWRLVEEREPPPIDGTTATADTLRAMYPDDDGSDVEVMGEVHEWARELADIGARRRDLEDRERALKSMILGEIGSARRALADGVPIVSAPTVTRTVVDSDRLEAEHPDIAAEFVKPVTYRRVTVLKGAKA